MRRRRPTPAALGGPTDDLVCASTSLRTCSLTAMLHRRTRSTPQCFLRCLSTSTYRHSIFRDTPSTLPAYYVPSVGYAISHSTRFLLATPPLTHQLDISDALRRCRPTLRLSSGWYNTLTTGLVPRHLSGSPASRTSRSSRYFMTRLWPSLSRYLFAFSRFILCPPLCY